MGLFQFGDFKLHSGSKSKWKIECDALTDEDIETLALMIREMVGPFDSVEGVPTGGLRLADALRPYGEFCNFHLIVDDVLTTGNSMNKLYNNSWKVHQRFAKGAVIFARGKCPSWVKPLFQMKPIPSEEYWTMLGEVLEESKS